MWHSPVVVLEMKPKTDIPTSRQIHHYREYRGGTSNVLWNDLKADLIALTGPLSAGCSVKSIRGSEIMGYSGCSGWVCSSCLLGECFWQKSLWMCSSSDTKCRPISKCMFRFSNHASSLVNAGLQQKQLSSLTACVEQTQGIYSKQHFRIHSY